jgi:uncharacterized protein YceK
MKHTRNLLVTLSLLAFLTLGCSSIKDLAGGSSSSSDSNSSAGNTAILASDDTGIPECDKLIATIEAKTADKETSYFQRAMYQLVKSQVLDPIKKEIANTSAQDKKDFGKKCQQAMDKLAAEDANKK